jgi:hypothetical protein
VKRSGNLGKDLSQAAATDAVYDKNTQLSILSGFGTCHKRSTPKVL